MAEDLIRYDILAQEALRGVMRKVLMEVARTGLPGNHHFFITFLTGAPGVRVSTRLRERYPEQMTIVLQFQYWDLKVSDTGFEVGLSFSDIPERLEIPYSAVRGFYDPSVNFELEFDVKAEPALRGVSLLPEITGKEAPAPRDVVVDLARTSDNDRRRGLIRGTDKLLAFGDDATFQLYDLANDPTEKTDLAKKRPEKLKELKEAYKALKLLEVKPSACRKLKGAPEGRDYLAGTASAGSMSSSQTSRTK